MKALALSSGDLVVGGNGDYATISGPSRIRQDLALALAEPYGNDPYHLQWGSVLPNYVGEPLTDELMLLVRSEVVRVLQQYVDGQASDVATDALAGNRSRYSYGDLVNKVVSVTAAPSLTTIAVSVVLQTRAGALVQVNRTVTL